VTKIGADDWIRHGATAADLNGLARVDVLPPLIHLVDVESTRYVGRMVRADIVISGVGDTFHVPKKWRTRCGKADCEVCPAEVDLKERRELLNFCRMSEEQTVGFMRRLSGCSNKPHPCIDEYATITELLAVPAASDAVDGLSRDYREKIIALVGQLSNSNIRYRATGRVIAEPKRQRASMLATHLERLQSEAEQFALTTESRRGFQVLQVPVSQATDLDAAWNHVRRLTHDLTNHVTKIYGSHRETVLLAELLVFHSPAVIAWDGEAIKGVLDALVIGDSGQGKSTQTRRLRDATGLGQMTSGSTASRAGLLYHLDSKINDKRILRWGAFPLAHGAALMVDEAQNITRQEWNEFTTARSEGLLSVNRSIRAEHPSRVRLLCFANPPGERPMAELQYGIMSVHPEIGFLAARDLRRFDLVICVAKEDQSSAEVLNNHGPIPNQQLVPASLLRESILWAWTRRPEHCRYGSRAEDAIKALARSLDEKFGTPEIPLLITDAHEKVARLAFAFAALLHNTDEMHESVIVTPLHVGLAGRLLEAVYTHPNCAFDQYAQVLRSRAALTDGEYPDIVTDLLTRGSNREDTRATETLFEFLLTNDDILRPDLEAATGLGKDALSS
jgi:MCM P-loop domain